MKKFSRLKTAFFNVKKVSNMKNVVYYDDNVIEVILKNEYLEVHLLNVGASMFKLL